MLNARYFHFGFNGMVAEKGKALVGCIDGFITLQARRFFFAKAPGKVLYLEQKIYGMLTFLRGRSPTRRTGRGV
jgi:hypothetical protein